MKKPISVVLTVLALISFASSSAWAKDNKKKKADAPAAVTTEPERTESSSSRGGSISFERYGAGIASMYGIGESSTALSLWTDLKDGLSIQGLVGMSSSSPFQFGIGGIVRKTMSGNMKTGFHIGGGLHLGTIAGVSADPLNPGTSAKFYVEFNPLMGFHFPMPGEDRIGFSLDGGPAFQIRDGEFNMAIRGLSGLLGLSVHYFF